MGFLNLRSLQWFFAFAALGFFAACEKEDLTEIASPANGLCLNAGQGKVPEITPYTQLAWSDEFEDSPTPGVDPSCYSRAPTCLSRLDWNSTGNCSTGDFSKIAKLNKCIWSVWDGYDFWTGTGMTGYSPDQIEVSGGKLRFKTTKRTGTSFDCSLEGRNCPFVTGGVGSAPKENTPGYFWSGNGRFEARIRIEAKSGTWPAVWAWEKSDPGVNGYISEYDIMEANPVAGSSTISYFATLHTWGIGEDYGVHHTGGSTHLPEIQGGSWHTVGLERTGDRVKFYLDGCYVREIKNGDWDSRWGRTLNVNTNPVALILNLGFSRAYTATSEDATMEIEYVRAYQ